MKKLKPIEYYLKLGSKLSISIKERIFKEGILSNECKICGKEPIWNGKPLKMQIDHIDGNDENNRKENLRSICPNCHTQTDTFSGKNKGKVKKLPSETTKLEVRDPKTGEWLVVPGLIGSMYLNKNKKEG